MLFKRASRSMDGTRWETLHVLRVSFLAPRMIRRSSTTLLSLEAKLRRLHLEAFTALSAEERTKAERKDGEAPKKMPAPEREERMKELKDELTCMDLTGELEPSNNLIDKFAAMQATGELKYLRWDELTTRRQEMLGSKEVEHWKESHGILQNPIESKRI